MIIQNYNLLKRKVTNIVRSKLFRRRVLWNIALYDLTDNNLASIKKKNPIKVFSSKKLQYKTSHIEFIADPFLFVNQNELFLFFEEKKTTSKGYIKVLKTNDLKLWENCGVVLKEDFHLSYPNVFRYGDEILMIPEAAESDKILIYKSNNFPKEWSLYSELNPFKGRFVDSSIYNKNGILYLFTTQVLVDRSGIRSYKLLLYYSENLKTKWIEHPASPISENMQNARCGGSVFQLNNKIYRPAQDCSNSYGQNYSIFEIVALSMTEYREISAAENLVNFQQKWSSLSGHHFNLVKFNNMTIAATDGLQSDFRLNIFLNLVTKSVSKIFSKVKNM